MTKPNTLFEISNVVNAHFPPFDHLKEKGGANNKQVGGDHYKTAVIEPWDYCLANDLGYLESSAIKYITRWKKKGGIKDIEKAVHYLEKLIEWETRHEQNRS